MSGSIFAVDKHGSLIRMAPALYESEDLLQRLIADHPDVLHDANSAEGGPRRWLLVTREGPIPDQAGGSPRWSVDHLLLDQDGVPTFVEVKRSTDTRIRREVVGQMLDYAANAVLHWPVTEIQSLFQTSCERDHRDPEEVLREYLGDIDPVDYWESVNSNLASRTVRMLFVADVIPIELQRIIEFLNDQLRYADILGVEVHQYLAPGGELQVLVPRVVGRTSRAVDAKARSRSQREWDEASFVAAMTGGGLDPEIVQRTLDWAGAHGVNVTWGTGRTTGTLRLQIDVEGRTATVGVLDTSGKYLCEPRSLAPFASFSSEEARAEIVRRLNVIPAVELPMKIVSSSWAYIYPDLLADPKTQQAILDVASWVIERLRAGGQSPADSPENQAT